MFVLTRSNLPYFAAWVIFGLLNGFWLVLAARSYHRAAQHVPARESNASRSIWQHWLGVFGPAFASTGTERNSHQTLILKRRVRIGGIMFVAWIVIGNFLFFL